MMALEQRITSQPHPGSRKLGSNSRQVLRKLSQLISAYVDLGNNHWIYASTHPNLIQHTLLNYAIIPSYLL